MNDFSEQDLSRLGLRQTLAILLYKKGVLSLQKAAKLSGGSLEAFIAALSKLGISIIHYSIKDVNDELKNFK